jgi:membrane associated rhomboid family serine protease
MLTPETPLRVLRGRRHKVIAQGPIADLIPLARAGRFRSSDGVEGFDPAGPVPIHAVPELAPLVPTPVEENERIISRAFRRLLVFDVVIGALMLAALGVSLFSGQPLAEKITSVRYVLFFALFFFALFGLPLVPLARQRRTLRALRSAGIFDVPAQPLPPAIQAFQALLTQKPLASRVLAGVIVAAFFAAQLFPGHELENALAKVNDRILAGELWRLVTPVFVHAGFAHLFFNTMALLQFGQGVENLYGRWRFLLIFFAAATVGSIASVLVTARPSVGASGGVFGLMGALLAFGVRHRAILPTALRKRFTAEMGLWIGINIMLGLLATFIDNAAHLGGLAAGAGLGALLHLRPEIAQVLGLGNPAGATYSRRE